MIERLRRWGLSGGAVRVVYLSESRAEVELRACTGEVVEVVSSTDVAVIEELRPQNESWRRTSDST
jgi:hypothetical protein